MACCASDTSRITTRRRHSARHTCECHTCRHDDTQNVKLPQHASRARAASTRAAAARVAIYSIPRKDDILLLYFRILLTVRSQYTGQRHTRPRRALRSGCRLPVTHATHDPRLSVSLVGRHPRTPNSHTREQRASSTRRRLPLSMSYDTRHTHVRPGHSEHAAGVTLSADNHVTITHVRAIR